MAEISRAQIDSLDCTNINIKKDEGLSYAIIRKLAANGDSLKKRQVETMYTSLEKETKDAIQDLIQKIEQDQLANRKERITKKGAHFGKIVYINEKLIADDDCDPKDKKTPAKTETAPDNKDRDTQIPESSADELDSKTNTELLTMLSADDIFKKTTTNHIAVYNKDGKISSIVNHILENLELDTEPPYTNYGHATKEATKTLQGVLKNLGKYKKTLDTVFGNATLVALQTALSDPKIGEEGIKNAISKKLNKSPAPATVDTKTQPAVTPPAKTETPVATTTAPTSPSETTTTPEVTNDATNPDKHAESQGTLAAVQGIAGLKGAKSLKALGFTVVDGALIFPESIVDPGEGADYTISKYYEISKEGHIQLRDPDAHKDAATVLKNVQAILGLNGTKSLKSLNFRVNAQEDMIESTEEFATHDGSRLYSYYEAKSGKIQLKSGFKKDTNGDIRNDIIDKELTELYQKATQAKESTQTKLSTLQNSLNIDTFNTTIQEIQTQYDALAKAYSDFDDKTGDYLFPDMINPFTPLSETQGLVEEAKETLEKLPARIQVAKAMREKFEIMVNDGSITGPTLIDKIHTVDEWSGFVDFYNANSPSLTPLAKQNSDQFIARVNKDMSERNIIQNGVVRGGYTFDLEQGIIKQSYAAGSANGVNVIPTKKG